MKLIMNLNTGQMKSNIIIGAIISIALFSFITPLFYVLIPDVFYLSIIPSILFALIYCLHSHYKILYQENLLALEHKRSISFELQIKQFSNTFLKAYEGLNVFIKEQHTSNHKVLMNQGQKLEEVLSNYVEDLSREIKKLNKSNFEYLNESNNSIRDFEINIITGINKSTEDNRKNFNKLINMLDAKLLGLQASLEKASDNFDDMTTSNSGYLNNLKDMLGENISKIVYLIQEGNSSNTLNLTKMNSIAEELGHNYQSMTDILVVNQSELKNTIESSFILFKRNVDDLSENLENIQEKEEILQNQFVNKMEDLFEDYNTSAAKAQEAYLENLTSSQIEFISSNTALFEEIKTLNISDNSLIEKILKI